MESDAMSPLLAKYEQALDKIERLHAREAALIEAGDALADTAEYEQIIWVEPPYVDAAVTRWREVRGAAYNPPSWEAQPCRCNVPDEPLWDLTCGPCIARENAALNLQQPQPKDAS